MTPLCIGCLAWDAARRSELIDAQALKWRPHWHHLPHSLNVLPWAYLPRYLTLQIFRARCSGESQRSMHPQGATETLPLVLKRHLQVREFGPKRRLYGHSFDFRVLLFENAVCSYACSGFGWTLGRCDQCVEKRPLDKSALCAPVSG